MQKIISLLPLFISVSPFITLANNMETITVSATKANYKQLYVTTQPTTIDVADNLTLAAGANVNKNGTLTGIVQYRGLYGDRIATQVGGQTVSGAGPNAMDTPLSYSPSFITKDIVIYRGIAPVSAGIETLGGAVDTILQQAELSTSAHLTTNGKVRVGFQRNGDANNQAVLTNVANSTFALQAYIDKKQRMFSLLLITE